MNTNTLRTLAALLCEGDTEATLTITDVNGDAEQFAAVIRSGGCPAFTADANAHALCGYGTTPKLALRDLEDICSGPAHLAALTDADL